MDGKNIIYYELKTLIFNEIAGLWNSGRYASLSFLHLLSIKSVSMTIYAMFFIVILRI